MIGAVIGAVSGAVIGAVNGAVSVAVSVAVSGAVNGAVPGVAHRKHEEEVLPVILGIGRHTLTSSCRVCLWALRSSPAWDCCCLTSSSRLNTYIRAVGEGGEGGHSPASAAASLTPPGSPPRRGEEEEGVRGRAPER